MFWLELQINTLKKKNVSSVRHIIWEKLYENMQKKWYTQETFWEQIWKSSSYINQLIKWKTWTSKVYINLLQILWVTNQEIIEIYKNALDKEKNIIFWDIWMKELSIQDNWQEPITTVEEAEKILFKLSGVKYSDKAKRKLRLAMDMIREDEKED